MFFIFGRVLLRTLSPSPGNSTSPGTACTVPASPAQSGTPPVPPPPETHSCRPPSQSASAPAGPASVPSTVPETPPAASPETPRSHRFPHRSPSRNRSSGSSFRSAHKQNHSYFQKRNGYLPGIPAPETPVTHPHCLPPLPEIIKRQIVPLDVDQQKAQREIKPFHRVNIFQFYHRTYLYGLHYLSPDNFYESMHLLHLQALLYPDILYRLLMLCICNYLKCRKHLPNAVNIKL